MKRILIATAVLLAAVSARAGVLPDICVTNGLIALYDGSFNATNAAGRFVHDASTSRLVDLVSGRDLTPEAGSSYLIGNNFLRLNTAISDSDKTAFSASHPEIARAYTNQSFTFEMRLENAGYYNGYFTMTLGQAGSSLRPLRLYCWDSKLYDGIMFWATSGYSSGVADPGLNTKHTVTITVSGTTHTFYLDGVQKYQTSGSGTLTDDVFELGGGHIGSRSAPASYYAVRAYDRVLTADEIAWNRAYDRMRFEGVDAATAFAGLTPPPGCVVPTGPELPPVTVSVTNFLAEATLSLDGGASWHAGVSDLVASGGTLQVLDKAGFTRTVPAGVGGSGVLFALPNCQGLSTDPSVRTIVRPDGQVAVVFTNATEATFLPGSPVLVTETLAVGGGGAGGSSMGGGGGGGGVAYSNESFSVQVSDALVVTAGAGGTRGTGNGAGNQGGTSVLSVRGTLRMSVAGGGGGGGLGSTAGKTGGSGGGGCNNGSGGNGTAGLGFAGGKASSESRSGGGGGAGGPGQGPDTAKGISGRGGPGFVCSITGTARTYGAGGGGGGSISGYGLYAGGAAGGEGAGNGGKGTVGEAGTDGTGGGGGGGGWTGSVTGGGVGGSGTVILSVTYPNPGVIAAGEPEFWESEGSPEYGQHPMADGASRTFTAPAIVSLNEADTERAWCRGYRTDTFDPLTMQWTLGSVTNEATSYTHVQSGTTCTRLVWIWQKHCLSAITNTLGEAVLSLDGGETWFAGTNVWLAADADVTLTVRADVRERVVVTGHSGTANTAAGTFVTSVTEPMDLVARDDLVFAETLVSTGAPAEIDTGVVCSNHQFAVRFKPKAAATAQVLLGSDDADTRSMRLYASGSYWYCRRSAGDAVKCVAVNTALQTLTYNDTASHSFYVDSAKYQSGALAGTTSAVPVAVRFQEGELRWVRANRADGTLVRDLRPCHQDGTPGLFDMTNRRFHPNTGGTVRTQPFGDGVRFDPDTGLVWYRTTVTNATGEAILSSDGGATWCAGWTSWTTNGATMTVLLHESVRQTTVLTGGSFTATPAAGTYVFTTGTASADVKAVPMQEGRQRWNADFTGYEYLLSMTNLSGEALLTKNAGSTWETALSDWVTEGGEWRVGVRSATGRIAGWGDLPPDTSFDEGQWNVTFSNVSTGFAVRVETFTVTHVWSGAAGTDDFATAGNWKAADGSAATSAPGADSTVYIPAGATAAATNAVTVSSAFSVKALHVGAARLEPGGAKLTFKHRAENAVEGNVHFYTRAFVTHTYLPSSSTRIDQEVYRVALAAGGDFSLEKGAAIDVTSCGYAGSKGPGFKLNTASHGGRLGTSYGECYGSLACPTNHGSGADRDRRGGGSVRVAAGGELFVNGTVAADGQWLSGEYNSGAGGSVWLSGATLTGAGVLRADGGRTSYGSSGSGGRVAVHLSQAADFSAWRGTFSAHGGSCVSTGHASTGAPGTIYLQAAGQTRATATVIVDNADLSHQGKGQPTGFAEFSDVTESDAFGTLIVRNNGSVRFLPGATYTFAGSLLTHDDTAKYSGRVIAYPDVTLVFTGATETVITGTNALPRLRCTEPGKTIRFGSSASDAFPILGGALFEFRGSAERPITLTGVNDDLWWIAFGPQVRQDVRYAVVNASDASGGLAGMAYASAAGTAGNVNWHLADLPAPGASVTWNGSVSGDWNDARNWTPARVPMETDAVTVPGSAPDMPTVASNDVTVATLTVEAGASLSLVALNLTVTGNVRVAGALAAFYRESLIAGGNVDFSGANVTPAEMTLLLTGDAAQTVNLAGTEIHDFVVRKSGGSLTVVGDFTCADLDLRETGALTCLFGAGNTVTCADLRVTGVTLGSTVSGTRWKIDVRSSATVLGIQVSDSEATGLAVFADSSSRETPGHSDSNVRWYFGSLAQTWTGAAGDGKWETAGNWSPADVPGPTSRVVIASATTVTAAGAAVVQNLVVGDGTAAAKVVLKGTLSAEDGVEVMNGATLTANKPMSVKGNMSVREGGTLTHTELPAKSSKITDGVYAVDVTCGGSFNLEAGGTVNVVGKGYPTGYGPGYANNQGAHGGSFYEGKTYGSAICPTNHGSASNFKPGGGVVRITADGDVCVNGTITAEGDYRTGEYNGAAGGSVWLTGARLTGSGTVSVNGGFATYGYSGGGGRLAVHLTEATDFSDWHGNLTARGGKSGSTNIGPHGPAGTIYLQTAGGTRTNATLIVDNEELTPVSSGWADLDASSGTDAIGTVIVANNARVCVKANEAIDVYGDWFARGGWMRVKDGALVRFAGAGDHLVTGSNDFCDVTCEAPGATMRFGTLAEDCFTIGTGHRLTWKGTDGYPLSLLPFPEDAGAWRMWLKTDCSTAIEYVSASNSDARAGLSVLAIESHDLGGNRNWGFSARIYPGDPIYWTGAGGTASWIDTANWEDQAGGHRAPIESDRVVIPKPGASPSFWPVLENGTTVQNKIEVNAGGELTLRNVTLYVTNALTVAGTLKAPGGEATVTVICSNAVDFAGGTFEEGLSVFRLEGAQTQSVNPGGCSFHRFEILKDGGSVTFGAGFTAANLDVLTTDPVTLAFAAGETVTAAEAYVRGRRTDTTGSTWPLVLKSAVADSAWYLNTTAVHYFSGVDVSDSTATGARIVADAQSRNGGNNVNWLFADKASEWTGAAGDDKWETAGNWYPEGVPDASTRAYLTGRAGKAVTVTVSQETAVSNLTLGAGLGTVAVKAYAPMTIRGDLEVRTNGTFSVNNTRTNSVVTGNVAVRAGGTITHEPLPNTIGTVAEAETKGYRLRLSVGGDVTVDAGGAINVTGKGYAIGKGPGISSNRGAHGGTLYEGKVYGSASCPTNHGSASSYKPGGGAVRLEVTGTLTVNGSIVSEGDYRTGEYNGAAGGSVWLSCARILGAGTVSANGGFATYGYSGGGGRLALYLTQAKDLSAWHGTLTARGGKSGSTSNGPHGPAGTVYVRTAGGAFADGAVFVDNGGLSPISSGWTELYPEAELAGIGAIAVTNYATARIGTDTPRRTFRRASLDVGAASRTDVRTDVYLRDLVLSSPTATLNLATNTVTVLSATHRDGRRWAAGATVTSQTNDVTGVCGKIVWKVQSTVLIVR